MEMFRCASVRDGVGICHTLSVLPRFGPNTCERRRDGYGLQYMHGVLRTPFGGRFLLASFLTRISHRASCILGEVYGLIESFVKTISGLHFWGTAVRGFSSCDDRPRLRRTRDTAVDRPILQSG